MRQRRLLALLVVVAAAVGVRAASSESTLSVRPLPARGLAVATANATLFLDFRGRELARLPGSYALSRTPRGALVLSSGNGSGLFVLRPATGALVPTSARGLRAAPAWAHKPGCRAEAVHGATWYLACSSGIVAVTANEKLRTLAKTPAPHEWVELAVSPDGKTLLANASRDCDGREAYVLPTAGGGTPRLLVTAPMSFGAGWTGRGEAVVWLPRGGLCSARALRPGVWAIGMHGSRRALLTGRTSGAATWGS